MSTPVTPEPINCTNCSRPIGERRPHIMLPGSTRVLCTACISTPEAHAREFPTCAETWHDAYDHPLRFCTRAAARRLEATP